MTEQKIGIFGVPRSGTTWLSQIFNSHPAVTLRYQPLFSYTHKGRLTEHSTEEEVRLFFDEINVSQDPFVLMKTESQSEVLPSFAKASTPTHLIFKETRYLHIIENILMQCAEIKIIGIVRNPLATLTSWIKAPREYESDWDIKQEWRYAPRKNENKVEEFYGFEKWKEVACSFLRFQEEYPEQFLLIRYEDLKANPLDRTKEIFKFCDLESSPQVEEFLMQSRSQYDPNPYSVFRSKTTGDDWNEILPSVISDSILSELSGTPLYTFID